mmetsp:Transcript_7585/g.17092  ORF Transcript_7585/g.17092 Transcript_7585/m.17092 type:complete len:171 (+) Transcript_7585:798-1310(+)
MSISDPSQERIEFSEEISDIGSAASSASTAPVPDIAIPATIMTSNNPDVPAATAPVALVPVPAATPPVASVPIPAAALPTAIAPMPIEPIMGGLRFTGKYYEHWTGGKPNNTWTGLDSTPRSIKPNQARSEYSSKAQISYDKRQNGLYHGENDRKYKDKGDLDELCHKLK